jgi:hypothetical protein
MSAGLAASSQGLAAGLSLPPSLGRVGGVSSAHGAAVFSPVVLLVAFGLALWLARTVAGLGAAERRRTDSWLCGYLPETDVVRYRAHGMYGEFKRYFGWVGGAARPAVSEGQSKESRGAGR